MNKTKKRGIKVYGNGRDEEVLFNISVFSFCRRIYLEVMLMLALFFGIGIVTLYYCVYFFFVMWIEYGWLLLSMFSATCFIFIDVKIMRIMVQHDEKKKWKR